MRPRDLLRAIGAARVHYDDFVGNVLERSQRTRQVRVFIQSNEAGGDAIHGGCEALEVCASISQ